MLWYKRGEKISEINSACHHEVSKEKSLMILVIFTSSVLCHLEQFGVDGLIGLAQDRDQVVGLFHVVGCKEGVGCARFLTAGRAANSVDIVLRGVRVVIIDDKFHILHICKVLQCGKKKKMWRQFFLYTTAATPKKTQVSKDSKEIRKLLDT